MSFEIGQIIDGKYRIIRMIGEGGMGAVYEGENSRIRRRVAIKILHASAAANGEAVQRFEREAQAAGRIGSDHILEILDLGAMPNGDRFMVMEFLDGEPLSSRIKGLGKLSAQQLVPLAKQLLTGLAAAHGAGIIHRDLKPDNVYILKEKAGQPDYVKIIDFGISKFQQIGGEVMSMTRTGTVMGTPYYMSPEQANGSREADARSDLYSVGVMLFEAVTGQVPFDARSFNELLFKIVLAKPPWPQTLAPDLEPSFATIVRKAMAREVEHRFQSALEFSKALDEWSRTGKGVDLPPEDGAPVPQPSVHDLSASVMAAVSAEATAGAAGQDVASGTKGGVAGGTLGAGAGASASSWATSQADAMSIPKQSSKPLFAALAVVGVLLLGGGSWALLGRGHDVAPGAAASGAAMTDLSHNNAAAVPHPAASATGPTVAIDTAAPEPSAAAPEPTKAPDKKPAIALAEAPKADAKAAPVPMMLKPAVKPAAGVAHPKSAHGTAAPDFGY